MDAERLQEIEERYHAALEIPSAERNSFIEKSCGGDEDLRLEVEELIAVNSSANTFFDEPPGALAAELFAGTDMPEDLSGKVISHYKIIRLLGSGGMGEVYLAEDTKLHRQIALKILTAQFETDVDRIKRFNKEARAVSALNHPNIITIYAIEETDAGNFIATEFIDGHTLRERVGEPFSLMKNVKIAIQIASALDSAHSLGIVHRDIKPANIMIRRDGIVKVLDFGLAKLTAPPADPRNAETREHTAPNRVMGTVNYMSPEQAKGKTIDTRTDIFSFGVVFYQMLAGKLPFQGETSLETIGAILHKEPEPLDNYAVPPEIAKIVSKCLRKDRDERYQTIKEVLKDLEDAKGDSAERNTERMVFPQEYNAPTIEIVRRKPVPKKLVAISLIVLFVSAVGFFAFRSFTAEKQIRSIAVMPFVNETGDQEVEYLSDGITENLIRRLSNIPELSIKARSTVFTYKGKSATAKQIGKELNVDAVLFGRLIRLDDAFKIDLELVDASTQDVLWAENYERKMNELASLESEIAINVSDNLRLKLTNAEQVQIAKTYTTNSEAQRLYLKGRFHWNKRNKEDFERSIEYFKQAIEKDPNFALAYAGLADSYALLPLYGNYRPKEYKPLARQAALRALELDPDLAEAHASLGYIINTYDFDWEGAEREYKTAIKLNPNYATAHQWYAEHLAFKGRTDAALLEISKALELDPFSVVINRMKGNVLGFAGRYEEAITQLKKTIALYPENSLVRFNLGDAFAAKGMYSDAIGQYLLALKLNGQRPEDIQKFEAAYKNNGWKGFWTAYLASLEKERKVIQETDPNAYFESEGMAYAYAATGNKDKALEYLAKAYEERDPNMVTIRTSEVYDFLSNDPRFEELTKNIGLSE